MGRYRPGVEALDDRQLLSGGVTADLAGGVLMVLGSDADDRIAIDVRGVATPRGDRGLVIVEGVGRFRLNQVSLIAINGGAGDDAIRIDGAGPARPALIAGGPGADTIVGGPGPNIIDGGPGDDTITGGPGDDVIASGGGLDRIDPGLGRDVVDGVTYLDGVPQLPPPAPPAPAGMLTAAAAPAADPMAQVGSTIVALTNQMRQQAGLAPLTLNASLTDAAHLQADQMAAAGQMEHTLPGAAFPALTDRIAHVGYSYAKVAENIAVGYTSAEAAVAGWMASPPHRANILDPDLTDLGASAARDPRGNLYFCQVFGRPAAPAAA